MSSAPACGQNSPIPRPLQLSGSVKSGGLPASCPCLSLPRNWPWGLCIPGLMLPPCLCLGGPFSPFLSLKHLLMFIEVKSTQRTPCGWHAIWHLHLPRDGQPPLRPRVLMAPEDCHEAGPFTCSLSDAPDEGPPSPHNTYSWPHHPCND